MPDYRTLLRREESYAIHALINIAENPGTHAARIAADLAMPPAFMAKVLRKLVAAGLIESKMGRSGGVRLLVDAADVSLVTVIEAVSGPLILDTCQIERRCATQRRKGHCHLNGVWLATTLRFKELLGGITLAQLHDPPSPAGQPGAESSASSS